VPLYPECTYELNLKRRKTMFFNVVGRVSIVFGWRSFFDDGNALKFLRSYCGEGKSIVFFGMKLTHSLDFISGALKGEGFDLTVREPVDGKAYTDLVQVGEFAQATLIICERNVQSLLGALKGIGLTYHEQDGGVPAFDTDATIMAGYGDAEMRLSRMAHLLVEAQAAIPALPESMADFADYLWGQMFDYYISCVGRNAEALKRLENFPRVECLAATAKEIAGGVWVVDARERPTASFAGLMNAIGHLPDRVIGLVRMRGRSSQAGGSPKLGIALVDEEQRMVDFKAFAPDQLPPELAAIIAESPDLDVPDKVWSETVIPAFQRKFGPPKH
jgi:hypothetical protein